jgi:hypothetical protein
MQPTYVNYGVVMSIDVEKIAELKALLQDLGAKLVYQKVSSDHLTVIEKNRISKVPEEY